MLKISKELKDIFEGLNEEFNRGKSLHFIKKVDSKKENVTLVKRTDKETNVVRIGQYVFYKGSSIGAVTMWTIKVSKLSFKLLSLMAQMPYSDQVRCLVELSFIANNAVVKISERDENDVVYAKLRHLDNVIDEEVFYSTLNKWFKGVELTTVPKNVERLTWWLKHGLVKE